VAKVGGVACVLAVVLVLAGCHQGKQPSQTTQTIAPTHGGANDVSPAGLVLGAGRLVLPAVQGNPAAAYFTLANKRPAGAVLAAVMVRGAARAEMHQTTGSTMNRLDQVKVPAGGAVVFAPGGRHVMVFGIDPKWQAGGTAHITLTFGDGTRADGSLKIEAAGGAPNTDDMGGMMPGMKM